MPTPRDLNTEKLLAVVFGAVAALFVFGMFQRGPFDPSPTRLEYVLIALGACWIAYVAIALLTGSRQPPQAVHAVCASICLLALGTSLYALPTALRFFGEEGPLLDTAVDAAAQARTPGQAKVVLLGWFLPTLTLVLTGLSAYKAFVNGLMHIRQAGHGAA